MPASSYYVLNTNNVYSCESEPKANATHDWDCCPGGLIVNPQPYLPRNGAMLVIWSARARALRLASARPLHIFRPLLRRLSRCVPLACAVLLLAWVFMGVALGADAFMTSIETITSQTKVTTVTIRGHKKRFHTRVWNDTVANLTLMALGSSAPEILLAIIEIAALSPRGAFYAGELGPSTIIGSAAFNLMVICGVCVVSIPAGETRTLKHLGVFIVTASFSIFAYFWMVIVLVLWTPNLVTLEEAMLTLFFMLVLVLIAFAADRGAFSKEGVAYASKSLKLVSVKGPDLDATSSSENLYGVPELTEAEVAKFLHKLEAGGDRSTDDSVDDGDKGGDAKDDVEAAPRPASASAPPVLGSTSESAIVEQQEVRTAARTGLNPEEVARELKAQYEEERPRTKTEHRANALKGLTGGFSMKKSTKEDAGKRAAKEGSGKYTSSTADASGISGISLEETKRTTFVGFATSIVTVTEGDDAFAVLPVMRHGCLDGGLSVQYATRDGTAKAASDYTTTEGTLTFAAGVQSMSIKVPILDDDEIEDDEEFYVTLSEPRCVGGGEDELIAGPLSPVRPRLAGPKLHAECSVVIKDDDVLPGTIGWKQSEVRVVESDGLVTLVVERRRGHNGEVSINYDTKPKEALEGVDYVGAHGTLTFAHAEMSKSVTIKIVDDTAYEKDETFLCVLSAPTGGAIFRDDTDGGDDEDICTVTIVSDGGVRTQVDRVMLLLNLDRQKTDMLCDAWKGQLQEALCLPAEERGPAKVGMHVLMLPWKLLFGLCPPPDAMGGWALFIGALMGILIQVILIGDLASQLGCQLGLSDGVTAITVVALGTSLPDLFASMQAAREDPTADNSVGNVTGSNSVNVFLGLGVPFAMASIYWAYQGPTEEWISYYPNLHANSYPNGTPTHRTHRAPPPRVRRTPHPCHALGLALSGARRALVSCAQEGLSCVRARSRST